MAKNKPAASSTADPPFAVKDWPAFSGWEKRKIGLIKPNPNNAKKHPDDQIDMIGKAIVEFGWTIPLFIDEKNMLIAGEGRWLAAKKIGVEEVPVIVARGWSATKKRAYLEADNRLSMVGAWDDEAHRRELEFLKASGIDMMTLGWAQDPLDAFLADETPDDSKPTISLASQFGIVPFSVLNARDGIWQDRKRAWLALGIASEVGRGENLLKFSDSVKLDGKKYQERAKSKAKK